MSLPAVRSISDPVRNELKAACFCKTGPNLGNTDSKAIVLKIDRATQYVVIGEVLEDLTVDELREEGRQTERRDREFLLAFRVQT